MNVLGKDSKKRSSDNLKEKRTAAAESESTKRSLSLLDNEDVVVERLLVVCVLL